MNRIQTCARSDLADHRIVLSWEGRLANTLVLYGLAVHRDWWSDRDDRHPADDRHVPWQPRGIALARSGVARVARGAAVLDTPIRGIQPAGDRPRLLDPGNDLREDRLSALSGMPDSARLLPGGEHRADVVRGAAGCL